CRHNKPRIAIRLFKEVIELADDGIRAIWRAVLAEVTRTELRGHHLDRTALQTLSHCAQAWSRRACSPRRLFPVRHRISLPCSFRSCRSFAVEMEQARLGSFIGIHA